MRRHLSFAALVSLGLLTTISSPGRAWAQPLQAGGLAPPPPSSGPGAYPSQPTETERLLLEADRADSGRGLQFAYVDLEGGGQYLSLEGFGRSGPGLLPSAPGLSSAQQSGFGPMFGAGAGVRLLFFTLGPRFRYASFSDWDLWSLGGDVGFHFPLGNLEPYLTLGAGYTKLGHATKALFGDAADVKVDGMNLRLATGADYFVTKVFSVGARASYDGGGRGRAAVAPETLTAATSGPEHARAQAYGEDGSGVGFAASANVVLGLHF